MERHFVKLVNQSYRTSVGAKNCTLPALELKDGNAAKVSIHNQIGSKKNGIILSQDTNDIITRDNDVYGIWEHDTQLSKIRSFNSL